MSISINLYKLWLIIYFIILSLRVIILAMNITYAENLVIGSGISGLSMSALLANNLEEVICLERHYLAGGCAGYFTRKNFIFDVGATTLSGMTGIGSLNKVIKILDLSIPLVKVDPGLVIHFGEKKLNRSSHLESWIKDQELFFKESWIEKLWYTIRDRNLEAIQLAEYSSSYPITSTQNFSNLFLNDYQLKLKSLYRMFKSFGDLHTDIYANKQYSNMIDELLLIAAQNTSPKVPALIAYMALSYLEDCWYCRGGMKGLIDLLVAKIKSNKGVVEYNQDVQEITQRFDYFEIRTKRKIYRSKKIFSSLPIWDTCRIAKNLHLLKLKKAANKFKPKWGAIMGYFTIKPKEEIKNLYHQVHLEKSLIGTDAKSVFISLSPLNDLERNNGQEQTVTMSVHIDLEKYHALLGSIDREHCKKSWEIEFTNILLETFIFNILDVTCHGIGDPSTFEHFTGRYQGSVGGLPHDVASPIFFYPQFDTGVDNFYQLGDTTFPGQGIIGVMQGALNLFGRFKK